MAHFLVEQLRFARSEWLRGVEDIRAEDASRRFEPMNSIAWMVGHLAQHEQRFWLEFTQGITLIESLNIYGFGQPVSNPPLAEMWSAWHQVTQAVDSYLDTLTAEDLIQHLVVNGNKRSENIGTSLGRSTFHYWYHLGEAMSIRQLLGHKDLAQFVGDLGGHAPYK